MKKKSKNKNKRKSSAHTKKRGSSKQKKHTTKKAHASKQKKKSTHTKKISQQKQVGAKKSLSTKSLSHKKVSTKSSVVPKKQTTKSLVHHKKVDSHAIKQGVLETYAIEVDKAKVDIEIVRETTLIKYNLKVPSIGVATLSLLDEIRNELVTVTSIGMKEITDTEAFGGIKKRFIDDASRLIQEKLPKIDEKTKGFLVGKLIQDMLGLGNIEFLVSDRQLEEVVIPSAREPIRVYHKKYGWVITNVQIPREEDILNYSNIISRRVGRQINVLSPLLDAHLVSGDRVNSILYPISTKGNTITIRKFARDPYTIIDLINSGTINLDVAALLWLATEYEMNILISGGTASGKTVVLNACMPFIPPNHRVISVEDTRELMLPDFLYWTPLVTRTPNPEGKGEVSMLDLLVNSLRMRPDRIILGEMRRKEEAMVLFEAMHTGHSVYATLHADSAAETINRLTNPPLSIPHNLLKAVNLNLVMFRDRRKGVRRVLQVAEFEEQQGSVKPNILYRWIPEGDKIIKHSESSTTFEGLARNTGRSQREIQDDLNRKKEILQWLINHKVRDLNDVGKVMNYYYTNRSVLLSAIKANDLKKILGG